MNVLRGVAGEFASTVGHLVLYPTGLGLDWEVGAEAAQEPPCRPGHGTPVLFIPGFAGNKSIFTPLRRALAQQGYGTASFRYRLLADDVRTLATKLAGRVEQLCADTGVPRVHLAGHSLGGLVARYYVQRLGGSSRVDTVVTVATPHGGTRAARLLPKVPVAQQLRSGSPLLAELAEPAKGCTSRFLAFSGDMDELIWPSQLGRLEHPDLHVHNVVISGAGHLGLASHPDVVAQVCAQLDPR